jgi:hypothetical protein
MRTVPTHVVLLGGTLAALLALAACKDSGAAGGNAPPSGATTTSASGGASSTSATTNPGTAAGSAGAAATPPSAAAPGAPAQGGPAPMKLAKLGLQIDVPAGTSAMDGAAPDELVLVTGNADFTATIGPAGPEFPKTLADAKKDAKPKEPANLKEETLPDGWVLTYENTATGNFYVDARREIGGKAYRCVTAAMSAASQQATAAACKTLRP